MGVIRRGLRTSLLSSLASQPSNDLALPATISGSLRLCAFRGRSRHTSGFEPYHTSLDPYKGASLTTVAERSPRMGVIRRGLRTSLLSSLASQPSNDLALPATISGSLRLCAFRGRSRHTSGFEPYHTFELPPQELISSAAVFEDVEVKSEERNVRLHPTQGSDVFQWLDSSLRDEELSEAAGRCVLLHGIFEVWGHGRNQEEASLDAFRSGRFPQHCAYASWFLGVTSYGRSGLSKAQEHALVGGPVEEFLSASMKGRSIIFARGLTPMNTDACVSDPRRMESSTSDIRIRIIEDTCPPPASNLPRHVQKVSGAAIASREKRFYICRELQVGSTVGGGTSMGTSCRRPKGGILSTLALNGLSYRGPTAIEPEIALLMASLAKVRQGSRVLDPFCGSCSLLLPAAIIGAKTWGGDVAGPVTAASVYRVEPATEKPYLQETGGTEQIKAREFEGGVVDGTAKQILQADLEGLEGIFKDFEALGLVHPDLVQADVADSMSSVQRPEFYDAIITDPPYGIKEKIVTAKRQNSGGKTSTLAGYAEAQSDDPALPVHSHNSIDVGDGHRVERKAQDPTCLAETYSGWEPKSGARAVADANGLVSDVIWSLLSLARYSLKPGGRLCFFLPLRGVEARLESLPAVLVMKLLELDGRGERLSVVYATKQRMTSPNMCRWLLVLAKVARTSKTNTV